MGEKNEKKTRGWGVESRTWNKNTSPNLTGPMTPNLIRIANRWNYFFSNYYHYYYYYFIIVAVKLVNKLTGKIIEDKTTKKLI